MASTLGVDNPFRYRGYYYDTETGLYYLESRYYNPELGRMMSADSLSVLGMSDIWRSYWLCGRTYDSRCSC